MYCSSTTLAMLAGEAPGSETISQALGQPSGPICLCEPHESVNLSCPHAYCLECLEATRKTAASTSKAEFTIQCQDDGGTCPNTLSLRDRTDQVSSAALEETLTSSSLGYLAKHTDVFRSCPTLDCAFVYRRHAARRTPICGSCVEPIWTTCHANHGAHTCAEYKDIASGAYEAVVPLKRGLDIKDYPNGTAPIEKIYGYNDMPCTVYQAHICWVCLAFFAASDERYGHMPQTHGRMYDYA